MKRNRHRGTGLFRYGHVLNTHILSSVMFLSVFIFPVVSYGVTAPPDGAILKNYDIRHGITFQLPAGSSSNNSPAKIYMPLTGNPIAPAIAQLNAVDRLRSPVMQDLVVRWNPLNGLPHFLFRYHGTLTTDSYPDAVEACISFLDSNRDLFGGISDRFISELVPACTYSYSYTNTSRVFLAQESQGIPVYNGTIRFNLDDANKIISVSAGDIIPDWNGNDLKYAFSPVDAAIRVSSLLGIRLGAEELFAGNSDSENTYRYTAEPFSGDIAVSRIIFPVYGSGRPAWRVTILKARSLPALYQFIIDAETGLLLQRVNLTKYVQTQGFVFTEHPAAGPQEIVQFPDNSYYVVKESPIGWQYGNQTSGNNADVKEDKAGDDEATAGSYAYATGTPLFFNFTYTANPSRDVLLSITNLFYGINTMHDYMYALGFDEASGNFQANNFGRGGLENDFVYGDAQDGLSVSNAIFSPAVDGRNGRMDMGIFGSTRDSSLDMDVLFHEYFHGVSTRLAGGCNTVECLSGVQSGAMGEGFSDYIPVNLFNDPLFGEFSSNDYTNGIRTARVDANSYTYGDLCTILGYCETHADGEIWASTLWDLQKNLEGRYGSDDGRYIARRLVMESLKFSVCSPSFLDMRDAILLADYYAHSSANECLIWDAFSGRGMGYSATTTGDNDDAPIEASDLSPWCTAKGKVQFTQESYGCSDEARILLIDPSTVKFPTVTVTSGSGENEVIHLMGEAPFRWSQYIEIIEVASPGDVVPGNGTFEVVETDILTATYNDSDPPTHVSTADAVIRCTASLEVLSYKFENESCDDDSLPGYPELPGFLDGEEYADLVIMIANKELFDLHGVTVNISSLNPKVSILSGASQYIGTMKRCIGTSCSGIELRCQVYAASSVTPGETADISIALTATGYNGTSSPLQFTIIMEQDYELVTGLKYNETFETPSSVLWTHSETSTTVSGDEWHLQNCHTHSVNNAYHNGGTGCTDYSDNQGDPMLISPAYNLSTVSAITSRITRIKYFHDIGLGAEFPGFQGVELVVAGLADNTTDQNTYMYGFYMFFDNTAGSYVLSNNDLSGTDTLLDYSTPINLWWLFMIDVSGPEAGSDVVGSGYYLDDIELQYEVVEAVDQKTICTMGPTPTPLPTITPNIPTPGNPIYYPVPAGNGSMIMIICVIAGLVVVLSCRLNR